MYPERDFLFIGDFNLPDYISMVNGGESSKVHNSSASELVHDTFLSLNLRQINHMCNKNNRLLDLCFSSFDKITVRTI
jgi:hypothetical protein